MYLILITVNATVCDFYMQCIITTTGVFYNYYLNNIVSGM